MRPPANNAPGRAVLLRHLGVLLAVLAAVLAVRGPVCAASMSAGEHMSSAVAAAAPVPPSASQASVVAMPPAPCQQPATVAAGSTTGPGSCVKESSTVGLPGTVAMAVARKAGHPVAPSPAAAWLASAVPSRAATLHQLGLLRI